MCVYLILAILNQVTAVLRCPHVRVCVWESWLVCKLQLSNSDCSMLRLGLQDVQCRSQYVEGIGPVVGRLVCHWGADLDQLKTAVD